MILKSDSGGIRKQPILSELIDTISKVLKYFQQNLITGLSAALSTIKIASLYGMKNRRNPVLHAGCGDCFISFFMTLAFLKRLLPENTSTPTTGHSTRVFHYMIHTPSHR
jgi:hypothetical protein